jgi:hypothetical protein
MKPTKDQLHAVHQALYKRERLQALATLRHNISVLMNFNPNQQLSVDDPRNPAGSGPTWFVPATGAVDPAVLEAANDCDQIATALMDMHDDVGGVEFPAADKQHLQAAIAAEAASWTTRGQIWRAPTKPNVEADTKRIEHHVATAISEVKHVSAYLKPLSEVGQ